MQFSYSIADREAERRLLPLAAERGLAVVINRPFDGGDLFRVVAGKPLPAWAAEIDCANWAQFFLKFVVSHPAVTCAIPATSRVDHMRENMGALTGRLPDPELRERMVRHVLESVARMLPFDADTLFATLTQYHRAFWPLQWLALAAGAGHGAAGGRAGVEQRARRAAAARGRLALGGPGWHLGTFAGINFAAPLYGALFVLQAAILAWIGARGRVAFRFRPGLRGWAGLGLAVAAIVGYPLADHLGGAPWSAVRLPGAAPCPTALLTLGVLLLAEGRRLLWPMLIPALWTLVAGFTGYVLTIGPDQLLPLAGAAALVVALASDRRAAP